MGLAEYFGRNATAAAQILNGFDEAAFRDRVGRTRIAVALGRDAVSLEGRRLSEFVVRLTARFYGHIVFRGEPRTRDLIDSLSRLAADINDRIEFDDGPIDGQISVGSYPASTDGVTVFAGSDGWDAGVSRFTPQRVGDSRNPFGPGASASLAVAALFRALFLPESSDNEPDVTLSTKRFELSPTHPGNDFPDHPIPMDAHIVGIGAIGNSAIWALSLTPFEGTIRLIDGQTIELSNLQRYVLAHVGDVGASKVDVAARFFPEGAHVLPYSKTWGEFVKDHGSYCENALVGVDSAKDRMAIQASLPQWVGNAWTQPGDLGVSVHGPVSGEGACLNCLYLGDGNQMSQDEIVARALGVPNRILQVRELLYSGRPVPGDLIEAVASGLGLPVDVVLPFLGRPVRDLYVEGVCGGAVLPLGKAGSPHQDVHVPVAHQSALAGILLAAAFVRRVLEGRPQKTEIARINLLKPISGSITQPARKDPRGICICQDQDYLTAYGSKYDGDPD